MEKYAGTGENWDGIKIVKMGLVVFFPLSGSSQKNPETNQPNLIALSVYSDRKSILEITYSLWKNSALNAKSLAVKSSKTCVIAIIKES